MFIRTEQALIKHLVNSFKHFLQILQNLPMQNSYCDPRNFDSAVVILSLLSVMLYHVYTKIVSVKPPISAELYCFGK